MLLGASGILISNTNTKNICLFSILTIVFGGNHLNGADWINYLDEFSRLGEGQTFTEAIFSGQFEWLFSALMWGFSRNDLSYESFVLFVAFLNIVLIFNVFKIIKIRNSSTVLILFFLIEGWTLYHEQLRQSLAVSLGLISVAIYLNGHRHVSLFLVFLAAGFHNSGLFIVILLLIAEMVQRNAQNPVNLKRLVAVSLLLMAAIFLILLVGEFGLYGLVGLTRLQEKFQIYQGDDVYGSSLFNAGLLAYGIGFAILLQTKQLVIDQRNVWISVAWSAAMLWCLMGPWLRTVSILLRFEHYLLIFFPFVVGMYKEADTVNWQKIKTMAFLFVFSLTFSVRIAISPSHMVWLDDYQNIFLNWIFDKDSQSFEQRKQAICENLKFNESNFCD